MSDDDRVPADRLAEVRPIAGDRTTERTSDECRAVFLQSRDLCLSEETAAVLSDLVTALLSDMASELENLGQIRAPRVQAILHGEAATNGELEKIGYVCVQLLRALKQV